ncbi:sulfotransferase [Roseiconus lacunae]|uniref:sulfotransferase family protein n=1 Tax=Roseiconus lacunae TaxID=2605694 RepID=UPI00308B1C2C|nr:sulfotransferase [Stieleria sp. HD01]
MRIWNAIIGVTIRLVCLPVFLTHRVALRLDTWLYPSLQEVPIKKPLFIVGLPRSGTTLLHRLIAKENQHFTTMPLWELVLAPAVCQKRLVDRLTRVDRSIGHPLGKLLHLVERQCVRRFGSVHTSSLRAPEEDYLGLLPFGGCFLKVLIDPMNQSVWDLAFFDQRLESEQQQRLLSRYRGLVQRHLFYRGHHYRYLSKNPSFTSWLIPLSETFPDACFIGLRRQPEQCVPSQLSSLRDGMKLLGNDVTSPTIISRFVDLLAHYWFVLECAPQVLPPTRLMCIEYDELVSDSFAVIEKAVTRFGLPLSEDGRREVRQACGQQRHYRSRHVYSLEEFGLDRIPLRAAFGLKSHSEANDSGTSQGEAPQRRPLVTPSHMVHKATEAS